MKLLLTIGLLMLLCGNLHAQTSAADSLKAYIKIKHYVPISRKAKLPQAIMPCYNIILDSLARWYPDYKTYYVSLPTFEDNKNDVFFKIYQLSDIRFVKKWDDTSRIIAEENKQLNKNNATIKNLPADIAEKIQIVDDYGGSDGGVGIVCSKKDHRVHRVYYQ